MCMSGWWGWGWAWNGDSWTHLSSPPPPPPPLWFRLPCRPCPSRLNCTCGLPVLRRPGIFQARHSPDPADQTIWSFMRVQFNASKRHGLLAHLGYDSESIASSVAAYVASVSNGGAPTEVPAPAPTRSPVAAPASEAVLMPTGAPGDAASLFGGPSDVPTSAADFFGAPPTEAPAVTPTPGGGAGAPSAASPLHTAAKSGTTPPPLDAAAVIAHARASEEARKSEPTPVRARGL